MEILFGMVCLIALFFNSISHTVSAPTTENSLSKLDYAKKEIHLISTVSGQNDGNLLKRVARQTGGTGPRLTSKN